MRFPAATVAAHYRHSSLKQFICHILRALDTEQDEVRGENFSDCIDSWVTTESNRKGPLPWAVQQDFHSEESVKLIALQTKPSHSWKVTPYTSTDSRSFSLSYQYTVILTQRASFVGKIFSVNPEWSPEYFCYISEAQKQKAFYFL